MPVQIKNETSIVLRVGV
uniref:Uncharacterized protein n=1 Tax=Arundo donax TaxID=35708 RepID=A0A0A9T3V1_ARUDO